jgi:hypothetical protein
MQRQKPTQKQKATLPRDLQDGVFVYIPNIMVSETAKLLGFKKAEITPYVIQTVTLKALTDFIDSDTFIDYRATLHDSAEILEVFQAETEEIIREIQKELKHEKEGQR